MAWCCRGAGAGSYRRSRARARSAAASASSTSVSSWAAGQVPAAGRDHPHALAEQERREPPVPGVIRGEMVAERRDAALVEEPREEDRARALRHDPVAVARAERLQALPQARPERGHPAIDLRLRGELRRRRERRGDRDAAAVVGSGVQHAVRRDLVHQVRPPAERADREAVAHRLRHDGQVGPDAEHALRPGEADAEPGDHLVEDQHAAVQVAERPAALQEPGCAGDHAAVARIRLHDQRGDLAAALREQLLEAGGVVPLDRDQVLQGRRLLPGRLRHGRRQVRRGGEDRVEPSVVVAGELHDQRPAGGGAAEAQRGMRGLGAGQAEAQALAAREDGADLLRQLDLGLVLRARLLQFRRRPRDGRDDALVAVPEDDRAHAADEVEELVAVGVGQPGAGRGHDGQRHGPLEGPERGRDAARDHRRRAFVQRVRSVEGALGHRWIMPVLGVRAERSGIVSLSSRRGGT